MVNLFQGKTMLIRLLFLTSLLLTSCKSNYFDNIESNDIQLETPKPGEWRFEHKEKAQDVNDFQISKKVFYGTERNTIYIVPIGNFDSTSNKLLYSCKEYLQTFFQIPVVQTEVYKPDFIPTSARRTVDPSNDQFLASYINDSFLVKLNLPKRIAVLAISSEDLYPRPEWNYVFGLANYQSQVGIASFFRFYDTCAKSPEILLHKRLFKTASHEIGHMLGLHHCQNAVCVMNGSNSLSELDQRIHRLCSQCQRKLHYSLKFNPMKRTESLIRFFESNNLLDELKEIQNDVIK